MGDTSFSNVFQEECLLLYFKDSSLTRDDIEQMPPFEREMTFEMFKKFNEEKQKGSSGGNNNQQGQGQPMINQIPSIFGGGDSMQEQMEDMV